MHVMEERDCKTEKREPNKWATRCLAGLVMRAPQIRRRVLMSTPALFGTDI